MVGRQRPPVLGTALPKHCISWLHFRPALLLSSIQHPADAPAEESSKKNPLRHPLAPCHHLCQGKWLSKACPQELHFGHGRRHRVPPRGWGGTATTDPVMGVWAVGCSPAAACSSQSSCCHPHWSGRKKRFRWKKRQRMGMGWLFHPQPSGVRQHRVGNHGQAPAVGQVPGEVSDRGPVVAVGEAEEGDGLQEALLLLLLALQQVLALERSDAKSQGNGGCP